MVRRTGETGRERPEDVYRRARIGGAYDFGKRPALLVVDLNHGFTDPACPLGADLDDVVEAVGRLLDHTRRVGIPAIFTTIAYSETLADAGVWIQKIPSLAELRSNTKWVELDTRLGVRLDELVITKQYPSAFFGTSLVSVLASLDIDTVIVTGATTSGCVRATAVDAVQHGYPTIIPRECVGDRHEGPHEANLFDLSAKYADVMSLEAVLEYVEEVSQLA